MNKFVKMESGTFVKDGKEYDYVLEIAKDFPKKRPGNVRLRIIEERPAIRKIRTRYDPEITLFGQKNASMEISLGYDINSLNDTLKFLIYSLVMPFFLIGAFLLASLMHKIPSSFFPSWLLIILLPILIVLTVLLVKMYYKINMTMFAEYLKSRDLKKKLEMDGFRQ